MLIAVHIRRCETLSGSSKLLPQTPAWLFGTLRMEGRDYPTPLAFEAFIRTHPKDEKTLSIRDTLSSIKIAERDLIVKSIPRTGKFPKSIGLSRLVQQSSSSHTRAFILNVSVEMHRTISYALLLPSDGKMALLLLFVYLLWR